MRLTARRRITHRKYLEEMEQEHGTLARMAQEAARDPSKRALLEEWRWIASHPERAEEPLMSEVTHIFYDVGQFLRLLSPQRLRLLGYLATRRSDPPRSINELARGLDRDYRNVYDDIQDLADVGAVDLERVGNRVVPHLAIFEVRFTLDEAAPATS